MIDNILGNKAAMKIVRFLYASPNRFFSFLEMEKFLGVGREGMRQTLRKLEYANMVYTEKKGGKRPKKRRSRRNWTQMRRATRPTRERKVTT